MGAEGMVVDVEMDNVFIAQEWLGLYVAKASNFNLNSLRLFDVSNVFGKSFTRSLKIPSIGLYSCDYTDKNISAHIQKDAEGLALYTGQKGRGYLVVSVQG